jgi:hypothetical protein
MVMLHAITMSLALSTPVVPCCESAGRAGESAPQGGHLVRRFERKPTDDARRLSWHAYVQELDRLWNQYRQSGSTPEAFEQYKAAATALKSRHVYGDVYLTPIMP